jgi:hypothetical protein
MAHFVHLVESAQKIQHKTLRTMGREVHLLREVNI